MVRLRRYETLLALALICAASAAGCSSPRTRLRMGAAPRLAWPAPPAAPRVQLVGRLPASDDPLQLRRPVAVAGGLDDRLFVVDAGDATVHVFDFTEREHRVLRDHGGTRFRAPVGVALDGDGRAYVTDTRAGLIAVFGPGEVFERRIEGLRRPTGVAVDPARGLLYCVETAAHSVRQMDLGGRLLRRLGGTGAAALSFPTFVAVDGRGRVLVSDSLNARVAVFTPEGRFLAAVGQRGGASGDLARPKGVAADSEGHLYVADAVFGNVQVFDDQGALLLYFGQPGGRPGEFTLPGGLAIDGRDRLFVANTFNGRVDVLQYLRGGGTP